MGRKSSGSKSTYDRLKKLDPAFLERVASQSVDDLKSEIVGLAKYASELKDAKAEDQDLNEKKESLKLANQAYTEPLRANTLKTKFVLELLASKGK